MTFQYFIITDISFNILYFSYTIDISGIIYIFTKKMWTEKSNLAILKEVGLRIKEYRIRQNLQQKELAEGAGVGLDTVVRLEQGKNVSFDKILRILRELDMLENLEGFIPEPPLSPILMKKLQGKNKKRVRN